MHCFLVHLGLHAIKGEPITDNFVSFNVGGAVHLNAGDRLRAFIQGVDDTDWTIDTESGFSAVLVTQDAMCEACTDGFTAEEPCTTNPARLCKACTTCNTSSYEVVACTPSTDRVCASCSQCPKDHFEAAACTPTSDRVCTPQYSVRAGTVETRVA